MGNRFDGKRVFVTGASSGIGAAAAIEFARQGARVALVARRADRLEAVRKTIEENGGKAICCVCDVTDRASLDAAVARTIDELGCIDVVLANAGTGVNGPFADLTADDFRRQFDVNFHGVLNTVYATLPELLESSGRLGLVGSVMGRVTMPASAPYCTSKFAVCALAECLSYDLGALGVHVTLINPGFVDSEIRFFDNEGRFHADRKDPAPEWLVCPADKAARQIVRGMHKHKFEVIITRHGRLMAWFGRHFPRACRFLMRAIAARQIDRGEAAKR